MPNKGIKETKIPEFPFNSHAGFGFVRPQEGDGISKEKQENRI